MPFRSSIVIVIVIVTTTRSPFNISIITATSMTIIIIITITTRPPCPSHHQLPPFTTKGEGGQRLRIRRNGECVDNE